MYKKFGDGWYEFTKRQGFVLSELTLNILCWCFLFIISALERIRQDFLSNTQEAINNIEIRSSMENISKKNDQRGKLGACV